MGEYDWMRRDQCPSGEVRSTHAALLNVSITAVLHLMVGVGRVAAAGQAGSGDADREARVAERADRRRVLRSLGGLTRVVHGIDQERRLHARIAWHQAFCSESAADGE